MKTESKKSTALLWNPFSRIAGWSALGVGIIAIFLTVWIGQQNGYIFDGVLDIHPNFRSLSLSEALLIQLPGWIFPILIFSLAGILFSKSSFRVIDVVGTWSFSRIPYLIPACVAFFPWMKHGLAVAFIFSVIAIPFIIWSIALGYHAIRVSCNFKEKSYPLIFIGGLLLSETLAVGINFFLVRKMFALSAASILSTSSPSEAVLTKVDNPQKPLTEQQIQALSSNVVEMIQENEYTELFSYFSPKMRDGFGIEKFWAICESLKLMQGRLIDHDSIKLTKKGERVIALVPCRFKRRSYNLQLTWNQQGKIDGFFIRPPFPSPKP